MAIRKISELPLVNPLDESIRSQLSGSFVEISLNNNDDSGNYWFTSKKMNYAQLEQSIIQPITGTTENDLCVNFYTHSSFHKPVNVLSGLNLSGDIFINETVNYDDYSIIVNTGSTDIKSNTKTSLETNNLYLRSNNVHIGNETTPNMEITYSQITLTKPTSIDDILSVNGDTTVVNLTCTGTAKFYNTIDGTALRAKWADLAEMYDADSEYKPGTLVKFGGEKEITIATDEVNAVITTKPGLLLGENDTNTKLPIALVGKVPVKVIGSVKKFDKLVLSDVPGIAIKKNDETKTVIGISLNTIDCQPDEINLVESVVQLKF